MTGPQPPGGGYPHGQYPQGQFPPGQFPPEPTKPPERPRELITAAQLWLVAFTGALVSVLGAVFGTDVLDEQLAEARDRATAPDREVMGDLGARITVSVAAALLVGIAVGALALFVFTRAWWAGFLVDFAGILLIIQALQMVFGGAEAAMAVPAILAGVAAAGALVVERSKPVVEYFREGRTK